MKVIYRGNNIQSNIKINQYATTHRKTPTGQVRVSVPSIFN